MKKVQILFFAVVVFALFQCNSSESQAQYKTSSFGFDYIMHKDVPGDTPKAGEMVYYHVRHRNDNNVTFTSRSNGGNPYKMEFPDFSNGANVPTPVSDLLRLMSPGDSATVRVNLKNLPRVPVGYENSNYMYYDIKVVKIEKPRKPIDREIEKLETQLNAEVTPISVSPDGKVNTNPKLTEKEKLDMWNSIQQKQLRTVMEVMIREYKKGTLKKNNKYLTTKTGLKAMPVKMGSGPKPKDDSFVAIKFMAANVETGEVFDQLWYKDRYKRFKMGKSEVIPGLEEGVKLMNVGSNFVFFMPAKLAFGDKGRVGVPPNTEVCYVVTLNEIN